MTRTALAALSLAVGGCSFLADPEGSRHDRLHFDSPEQVVLFIYQNLAAGRYDSLRTAYLSYQDRRAWMVYDQDHLHPWTRDSQARAEIVSAEPLGNGDAAVTVREQWSGGAHVRAFRCHKTSDGWYVHSSAGEPGDGLLWSAD